MLYISDTAGAADLELQPGSPNVLFACMWHGQRKPWTIISGAREGGIYKSTDGGEHWTKLAGGLPNELFGRSNVAISAAAPNRIYALIEAKPGSGLYRSEDAGATWTLVNGSANLITRPFYYDTLGVDPNNADVCLDRRRRLVQEHRWRQDVPARAGSSARRQPRHLDQSEELAVHDSVQRWRRERIARWRPHAGARQLNQPTAEIYQVAVDNQYPYRVYGAQQDDNTVIVPSLPLGNGQDFRTGPGCETGPIIPDVDHPEIVYGGCKGQFSRLEPDHHQRAALLDRRRIALRQPGGELMYPLPARLADGGFALRSAHGLLRLAVRAPLARRRRHLGSIRPT